MDTDTCGCVFVVVKTYRNYFLATSAFSIKEEARLSVESKNGGGSIGGFGMYETGISKWEEEHS